LSFYDAAIVICSLVRFLREAELLKEKVCVEKLLGEQAAPFFPLDQASGVLRPQLVKSAQLS
jgi:hypothetical protein